MGKKRSIDFKALMLAHVEKIVLAIIAICFVTLLWFAVSKEGVPAGIEPADIQSIASQAKSNVTRTTWEDFSSKPQLRNFAQESGWYDVPFDPYELTTEFNPPNFITQGLRHDPKYFGIAELEAHFDQGPFALILGESLARKFGQDGVIPNEVQEIIDKARKKPPAPRIGAVDDPNRLVDEEGAVIKIKFPGSTVEENEVSEGRRWIMVTGLLPVQKQKDSFEEIFRNASGFEQKNDLPIYFGYEVERADVTGGVQPEWKQHDKVSSRSLLISMLRWSRFKRSEIIDPRYVHPIFTCPLPPRVLEEWSSRDKHSKVPLRNTNVKKEEARDLLGGPLAGLGEDAVEDLDSLVSGSRKTSSAAEEEQSANMKMVRYFDFDVEPGHTYQYRFRAVLRDPNYIREPIEGGEEMRRVEIKLLEQPVIARLNQKRQDLEQESQKLIEAGERGYSPEMIERLMQIIYTPWSDPSPAIKVPPVNYVLAVEAKPVEEGKFNEEPEATILTTEYDRELGLEMGGQTTMQRGSLSRFTVDRVRVINVDYNTLDFRQQTFDPNRMLLDVRGGDPIGESSLTAPGELLMFDLKKGKVVVNDEIEDKQSVREYEQRQQAIEDLIPSSKPQGPNGNGPVGIDDVLN